MKCPVCGAQNEPGTAYCYQCGSALRTANPPATGNTILMGSDTAANSQPDTTPTARTYETPNSAPTVRTYETPYAVPPTNQQNTYGAPYAAPPAIDTRTYDGSNHPLMQPSYANNQQPSVQTPYLVTSVNTAPSTTSTMAVFSLVLGILSWMFIPLIGAIGGVVTGHMARREIMNSGGRLTGNGMALAGLILSYINLLGSVALCALVALLVASS